MKKIKWTCDTGFAACIHEGELEIDKDATEEEIGEMVLDAVLTKVNFTWDYEE